MKISLRKLASHVSLIIFASQFVLSHAYADATANYRVTFDSNWSAANHPTDFPGASAHFSSLIGGTHNSDVSFWEPGGIATTGIEAMAESGSTGGLRSEVNSAINDGTAQFVLNGVPLSRSPGTASFEFEISDSHSLVSLVTMIAPSPDWFVGVHGLDLKPGGEWVGNLVHDLAPYDAGTDSGTTFRSQNEDTDPAEPISVLTGFPFEGSPPIGTFTFLRLITGDYNESGSYDGADIDALSMAIRANSNDGSFDLNGDNQVDSDDHGFLIKNLANTFIGDSNLDGEFNTGDLTAVFQAGEYEDGVAQNSTWSTGDWNGDAEFDTSDLVAAFQDGGFESGPAVASAVPEPNSLVLLLLGSTMLLQVSRRRR